MKWPIFFKVDATYKLQTKSRLSMWICRLCVHRYCYGQLSNMVVHLNSIYQLHLLGSISACFLKMLFNLYFSMFGYVIGTNGQKEHDELVRAICWNVIYGIRFLIIVYAANSTSKQVILYDYNYIYIYKENFYLIN